MALPAFFLFTVALRRCVFMIYDRQILKILTDVGRDGIRVQALAKHVFNMNRTLFFSPDMAEVYGYVRRFVARNLRQPQPLIESTGRRGYYRLNTGGSDEARQLVLDFKEETSAVSEEEEEKPRRDLSLDLFAE